MTTTTPTTRMESTVAATLAAKRARRGVVFHEAAVLD